jgi:hypothetical protein
MSKARWAVVLAVMFLAGGCAKETILEKSKKETEDKFREVASKPVPPRLADVFPKHPFWDEHGILLRDTTALRDAIFRAGQRLMEEDKLGAVTADTEREIQALTREAERLKEVSKGQRELPPDIVETAKVTSPLRAAWTKGMDGLTESLQFFGQYATAMEKMAKASQEGDIDTWNKLIGETNVLAYKGPNRAGQALEVLDDFHTEFRKHIQKNFGFDPSARP